MSKAINNNKKVLGKNVKPKEKKDIKIQESPLEKALKLSSEQIIAQAIRDLIKRDDLN